MKTAPNASESKCVDVLVSYKPLHTNDRAIRSLSKGKK